MLLGSRQLRWALSAVIAASVSFCCCEGGLAMDAVSLVANALSGSAPPVEGRGHGCCSTGQTDDSDESPCNDDGPCECDQQREVRSLPDAPVALDAASVALTFSLPPDSASSAVGWQPLVAPVRAEAVPRPPTALLRLHCALIV